jgi:ATP-dependent protease ClpP protease subunit
MAKFKYKIRSDDDDDDDDDLDIDIKGHSRSKTVSFDVKTKEVWVSGTIGHNFGREFIRAVALVSSKEENLVSQDALDSLIKKSISVLDKELEEEQDLKIEFDLSVFKKDNDSTPTEITIYLNSLGGNSMEAFPAFDYLMGTKDRNRYKIVATGTCMSAATLLLIAGDVRIAYPNCEFMIHAPYLNGAGGPAQELKDLSASLARTEASYSEAYRSLTELSIQQIRKLMKKDTFFSSATALKWGFVDRVGIS